MRLRSRFTITSMTTTIAGMHRPAIADALDAGEERKPLLIFGLGENQDRADLRDDFGENRRRQHERARRRARRYGSFDEMFLMPTIRLSISSSVMRSTSRNG